ncbi:MAG: transposase [Sedimentitalea sp.]|uniref:transposase n=1 Tax=Sedimentitalea sp. TaxID=2048915 RepID=UPI003266DDA2
MAFAENVPVRNLAGENICGFLCLEHFANDLCSRNFACSDLGYSVLRGDLDERPRWCFAEPNFRRCHTLQTTRKRRSWRKLQVGLDFVSGEDVCSDLTPNNVGDPTVLPYLLAQADTPVSHFLADCAYDGEAASDLLAAWFGSMIEVRIPLPKNAILSLNAGNDPMTHDCHTVEIAARARIAWRKATG